MESEYDRKFEEMKQYIPFLENLIKRLESTGSTSNNPRQAQLDKIKSLRVLLSNKGKRMKMDNLLKCEQVLINLYAKVEKREGDPEMTLVSDKGTKKIKDQSNLQTVRNNLKTVSKHTDTLPEIARASEIEVTCSPGSKEPALFQRRPNKNSPEKRTKSEENKLISKRYTRVLVSPDSSPPRWSSERHKETVLYTRRSPRRSPGRSPRRRSPHKKERKKTSKEKSRKSKDLNITLNVPEESLGSLNTKDILSRIINCSDSDVDIDTLRELRSKILGELKQTGANDDISELILRSYGKKLANTNDNKADVEEGELSDSESETIDNVYGNLVVFDKEKNSSQPKAVEDKTSKRKIQICLVINSENNEKANEASRLDPISDNDLDLEIITGSPNQCADKPIGSDSSPIKSTTSYVKRSTVNEAEKCLELDTNKVANNKQDVICIDSDENDKSLASNESNQNISYFTADVIQTLKSPSKVSQSPSKTKNIRVESPDNDFLPTLQQLDEMDKKTGNDFLPTLRQLDEIDKSSEKVKHSANFYKPLDPEEKVEETTPAVIEKTNTNAEVQNSHPRNDNHQQPNEDLLKNEEKFKETSDKKVLSTSPTQKDNQEPEKTSDINIPSISPTQKNSQESKEITDIKVPSISPTQNDNQESKETTDKNVSSTSPTQKLKGVSDIEILQALKNEILSEKLPLSSPEIDTPALHQPKLTKVQNCQEKNPKKRISIDTYKEKSVSSTKPLYVSNKSESKEGKSKQSLKLTEKECERFNVPARLSIEDGLSDEDDLLNNGPISPPDIYADLAPKSPEIETGDADNSKPVIIPVERVNPSKPEIPQHIADVDMRPLMAPKPVPSPSFGVLTPAINSDIQQKEKTSVSKPVILDPRIRKDISQPVNKESSKPHMHSDTKLKPISYANIPPLMDIPPLLGPSMTPSYTPSYTPSLTPMATPNARSYEMTPTRQTYDFDNTSQRKHVYAPSFYDNDKDSGAREMPNEDRRFYREERSSRWEDLDRSRSSTSMQRDNSSQYKYDKYQHGESKERREYSKSEAPTTPRPSFGWSDCPSTPSRGFGRDVPMTPSHSFGRGDCPSTPIHYFGRSDCPTTPSHPFGRSEAPVTPSHPFGRGECPRTPSHYFGRSEAPMTPSHPFGRSDSRTEVPSNAGFNKDPRLNRRPSEYPSNKNDRYNRGGYNSHHDSNSTGYFDNNQGEKRNERYNDYSGRHYNTGDRYDSREYSVGREENRHYSRNRERYNSNIVISPSDDINYEEVGIRRYQRERSVGRSMRWERPRENSRAPSMGRSHNQNSRSTSVGRSFSEREDNKLSVKPDTGRSFTIDTSVNTSFQNLVSGKGIQIFDYTFDARRQRASSVGRTLIRENSVGRSLSKTNKIFQNKSDKYKRASSVGRELSKANSNKSFKDLKLEFENFKSKLSWKNIPTSTTVQPSQYSPVYRSRKDVFERKSKAPEKQAYSPRKNYRDPRMRRDQIDHRSRGYDYHDRSQSGIVYSNDNIAKGAILGSGFGVRNYKIPKIKRVESEESNNSDKNESEVTQEDEKNINVGSDKKTENKDKIDKIDAIPNDKISKNTENKSSDKSRSAKQTETEKVITINKADETKPAEGMESTGESVKRVTRSSKKCEKVLNTEEENIITRIRRNKKNQICDSDSDDENKTSTETKNVSTKTTPKKSLKKVVSPKKKNLLSSADDAFFDPSFAMDDFEMFSDNMVSDPAIDNINEIIADLDNDLDTTKEVTQAEFETIMNSIQDTDENSLGDISDVIAKDLNESQKVNISNKNCASIKTSGGIEQTNTNKEFSIAIDKLEVPASPQKEKEKVPFEKLETTNNEAIVSTTGGDKTLEEVSKPTFNDTKPVENAESIPDSTISKYDNSKPDESVPDSTDQIHNEHSSDVTSTRDIDPKDSGDMRTARSETSQVDSLDSIISLLKDKSKFNEILQKLGEKSGETEKIKKKLEKLKEIVSDEENDNTTDCNKTSGEKQQTFEKESQEQDTSTKILDENTSNSTAKTDSNEDSQAEKDKIVAIHDSKLEDGLLNDNSVDGAVRDENEETFDMPDSEMKDGQDEYHETLTTRRKPGPKKKVVKRGKGKIINKPLQSKNVTASKPKKPRNRELQQLHEDLKEMFISNDVLNASGIRMCRLAKLVEDKGEAKKDETPLKEGGPVVLIQKCANIDTTNKIDTTEEPQITKIRKKPGPKPKPKVLAENSKNDNKSKVSKTVEKPKIGKPGPKCKKREADPYEFDTDSFTETNTTKDSDDNETDSDNLSLASTRSLGSNEPLTDVKKKKRKRGRSWQSGFIKPKNKKKKEQKEESAYVDIESLSPQLSIPCIPDFNCFVDKNYCFRKNVTSYRCHLCFYTGDEIVNHYKKQHPHTEIPLSRMDPETAINSIRQCEKINFQAVIKMPSKRYVCIFCNKEFSKSKTALEEFFWHVVSNHTGEYKQTCPTCVTATRCPFNLDIPPPPKDSKGQLIGYICAKCNFTQISLENLKTHVIVRHNDEETEVFTINLAQMSHKVLKNMVKKSLTAEPRVLRSRRSIQSTTGSDGSDDRSGVTESDRNDEDEDRSLLSPVKPTSGAIRSKITFETASDPETDEPEPRDNISVKIEPEDIEIRDRGDSFTNSLEVPVLQEPTVEEPILTEPIKASALPEPNRANINQIVDCAHFKIHFSASGAKEYVCCINGVDNHYKTTLLISIKRHVQTKHKDNWDGYCSICKVIVTLQGVQSTFRDCLEHYLDKHIDDLPVIETIERETTASPRPQILNISEPERNETPKSYIAVKPLADLISKDTEKENEDASQFPIIENIVSLGEKSDTPAAAAPERAVEKQTFIYEEAQAEIMSKKHRVVLDTMLTKNVLVRVFKCAGSFCSFTSDSVEEALLHASTHQRVGGEGALKCAYCNFDCSGNAIDLVMHVFKIHSQCQFACGHCFYRASASQLVEAHCAKVHSGKDVVVFRNSNLTSQPPDNTDLLSREAAVPFYVCYQGKGSCKFQTYIASKFYDHINQKHVAETWHSCYLCSTVWPTASDLVNHMADHGLKMYQCTWCVFGANNEAELITHGSAVHPNKQPQAYVRVINKVTNKGGLTQLRMLPLAYLNKSNVPVEDVTPSTTIDDAVREVERSIDLEKLINPIKPDSVNLEQVAPTLASLLINTDDDIDAMPIETVDETPDETPTVKETTVIETPNVKTEVVEQPTPSIQEPDVICLDSDEESPQQPPTNQTVENTDKSRLRQRPALNVVAVKDLMRCPYCVINVYGSQQGLSRHLLYCTKRTEAGVPCPHRPCNIMLLYKEQILKHYKEHADPAAKTNFQAQCGICSINFSSIGFAKRHLKVTHKVSKVTSSSTKVLDDGTECIIVQPHPEEPSKRKKSTEIPIKKYGIQDMNNLPITPIFDNPVYCELCEFSTKVRWNLLRHLSLHADKQSVPQTAPVNPVPHLETNEKHFDKMVNLASSSVGTRMSDKQGAAPAVQAETASRYPKYVPERQRLACGARGCDYISLNETMLKFHWETLHAGVTDYHCVHCPPYQQIDTSRPLSATRIIAHLKMHDVILYACSSCAYYHHKRYSLEKHINDIHKGAGKVIVVREEVLTLPATPPPAPVVQTAPTMDLKPWQCGLCEFKSMLRPEVAEHCAKTHQSKMQYKCGYCPFRTSAIENVTKHQSNSHPAKAEDIFYFFYKEGTIPDEIDGTPRWLKQKRKVAPDTAVKVEKPADPVESIQPPLNIDLNIVKKEVDDCEIVDLSMSDLCRKYGQFCEPSGIKYKCCLCNIVTEHTRESMKSHLFEELKYRRWSCGACSYKAFHREGLTEHLNSEHSRNYKEPTELPVDTNIEKWVTALLDHQSDIIQKNKDNFAKQKIQIEPAVSSPKRVEPPKTVNLTSTVQLEQAFGQFGVPHNREYGCPKCDYRNSDEIEIRNHLENELTKIRWCCSNCTTKFQTYHEAQFHCKSIHVGQNAKPFEAVRDPSVRCAWVTSVINHQRQMMKCPVESVPQNDNSPDNSLLVVRYAEVAQTDQELNRKRPVQIDSDDDKQYEPPSKKKNMKECRYCDFTSPHNNSLREHTLKHYNLKPYSCSLCGFNQHRKYVVDHIAKMHQGRRAAALPAPIPTARPTIDVSKNTKDLKKVCLVCENSMSIEESEIHMHGNIKPSFAFKGDVVVKCRTCLVLKSSMFEFQQHHDSVHPNQTPNYFYFKLNHDMNKLWRCGYCGVTFISRIDSRAHHNSYHRNRPLKLDLLHYKNAEEVTNLKDFKRCAKKSTTKLPNRTVARKSTSKLPDYSSDDEYSYYGTKPPPIDRYKDVKVSMPMFNTMVDINVEKLSDILKIEPQVLVKKS